MRRFLSLTEHIFKSSAAGLTAVDFDWATDCDNRLFCSTIICIGCAMFARRWVHILVNHGQNSTLKIWGPFYNLTSWLGFGRSAATKLKKRHNPTIFGG